MLSWSIVNSHVASRSVAVRSPWFRPRAIPAFDVCRSTLTPSTAATLRSIYSRDQLADLHRHATRMANLETPWQRRDNAGYWIDRRDMYAEALKEAQ